MPIDWGTVKWFYVGLLSVFVLVAALIGNVIAMRNRLIGAIFTAVIFAAIYVFWTYYPHGIDLGPNFQP